MKKHNLARTIRRNGSNDSIELISINTPDKYQAIEAVHDSSPPFKQESHSPRSSARLRCMLICNLLFSVIIIGILISVIIVRSERYTQKFKIQDKTIQQLTDLLQQSVQENTHRLRELISQYIEKNFQVSRFHNNQSTLMNK